MSRLVLSSGSVEAVKWLALFLMTGDHVNRYLLDGTVPALYALGRVAFPLFAVVVAYNLARPGADAWGAAKRLFGFGLLALVPHVYAEHNSGHALLLNVLLSFALSAGLVGLWDRKAGARVCLGALVAAGALVDFQWFGVALTLCAVWYFRTGREPALIATLVALGSLALVNGNHWAWLAVPVVVLASYSASSIPRHRWAFYAYYPAHLSALGLLAAWV